MEQSAYNAASKYNNELESGNTAETTRTLAQARDELSVGMQKEGEAAIGRGADAGLFRSRALESGKRNIAKLQGDLADKAFGRRNDAINTLSSTATRAAEGQRYPPPRDDGGGERGQADPDRRRGSAGEVAGGPV
jgi:hypothetical protein